MAKTCIGTFAMRLFIPLFMLKKINIKGSGNTCQENKKREKRKQAEKHKRQE